MAILQGLISLLSRSVGKIFSALFDWAVIALFGRVDGTRKLFLSGLLGAAALWPILLLGVAVPRIAVFVVAFVPLSGSVPAGWIRAIWLALVALVPITVGVVLRLHAPPDRQAGSWIASVARGVPITIGLSTAFVVLLATVPVLRIASAIRGRQDVHLPLVTTTESYERAGQLASDTLRHRGFAVRSAQPPWWSSLPVSILRAFGRGALAGYVPERTVYFRGDDLEVALYPNAVLLRGPVATTARAHGVLVEALSGRPDMLQTVSPEAQELERRIQRVWTLYRQAPRATAGSGPLLTRLGEIAEEFARKPLAFDDWQVIYRQLLQLDRALHDAPQLIAHALGEREAVPAAEAEPAGAASGARLSTLELFRRIAEAARQLVVTQIALARAEARDQVRAELGTAKLLGIAAVIAVSGLSLLLTAAALGAARWLGLSLAGLSGAALGLGAVVLGASAAVGYAAWRGRVVRPLAVTRKALTDDVRWMKDRVA